MVKQPSEKIFVKLDMLKPHSHDGGLVGSDDFPTFKVNVNPGLINPYSDY